MLKDNRELWWALTAVILISGLYFDFSYLTREIPEASSLVGHSIGVVGFLLMLSTETLYSLRKRSRTARWGRMSSWLRFHIFTGLVGPFMVLLHTSWKFNGLAGVVLLLTVIIVISGFIGRYIYTAIPRTTDGIDIESEELQSQIESIESELESLSASFQGTRQVSALKLSTVSTAHTSPRTLVLGRPQMERQVLRQLKYEKRRLGPAGKQQLEEVERLLRRRNKLQHQVSSLALARRLLATWHSVHIPIGMALFTAAFIHVGAALYYATLLR